MRALADLVSSSPWRDGFHTLWNTLAIEEVFLTPEELNDLVALSNCLCDEMGAGREAIVIAPDISRKWADLLAFSCEQAPRQRRLFHALQPARVWLFGRGASPLVRQGSPSRPFTA